MHGFVIFLKILGVFFCIILAVLIIGLLVASVYLLLQVALTILPACLVTLAVILLTQLIYFKHRFNMLKAQKITNLFTAGFNQQTKEWKWQLEESQIRLYADSGMAKFLSLLTGIISAWIFLNRLYYGGAFSRQIWWCLGQVTEVHPKVSLVIASFLLGFAVLITLIKSHPLGIFRKFLIRNADSFASEEDNQNLEQANQLFKIALEQYTQIKQDTQKTGSISLMMELEQINQALISENLASLVQNKRWQEFKTILGGIISDLQRMKQNTTNTNSWQANFWQNETDEEKACRILGVSLNATDDEIRGAYRRLALLWHPDRLGGDGEKMKEINWAYDVLKKKKQFA